jgi:hypothetical protein
MGKNMDPGSGINIPDPQHWLILFLIRSGDVSAGQLLCGGLFSADATSNWLCCAALAQVFAESVQLKEELLRVQLATQVGAPLIFVSMK